jgi:hypothetical protein
MPQIFTIFFASAGSIVLTAASAINAALRKCLARHASIKGRIGGLLPVQ